MRSLSGPLLTETAKQSSESTWLIHLQTIAGVNPSQDIYASTGGSVNWNSINWLALGFEIDGPANTEAMRFSAPNEQGQIYTMAAGGELKYAPVDLYIMYPGGSDAEHFMRGYVSACTGLQRNRATLTVTRFGTENDIVPSVQIAAPLWSKLPPSGLEFEWSGKLIKLEQARG